MFNGTPVSFDNNSLQTENFLVEQISHEDSPDKEAREYPIAHADMNVIPYVTYPRKVITLSGTILPTNSGSIQETDTLVDTFKGYFTKVNGNLDIGYGGSTRRYIGTVSPAPKITRPGGLGYAKFQMTIVCQPFGRNLTPTNPISATGRTLSSYVDTFTIVGNAPTQLPTITITYTAVTTSGATAVLIGNGSSGQQISVNRTWATNDVLTVNVEKREVRVNGILIDYTGAFPELGKGTQSISYNDSLTARTFNVAVSYYARWI